MRGATSHCQVRGCSDIAETTRFRTDGDQTETFYTCDFHGGWEIGAQYEMVGD